MAAAWTAADDVCSATWTLEIVQAIRPDATWRDAGDWRNYDSTGGLGVHRPSGGWIQHSTGAKGRSAVKLVEHLQSYTKVQARVWVKAFLVAHPGVGSCGNQDADGDADAFSINRAWAEEISADLIEVADAPSVSKYLHSRCLPKMYADCVKALRDARPGEDALVGVLTAHGRVIGYHLTYVNPKGAKSLVKPLYHCPKLEQDKAAVFDIPAIPGSTDTRIIIVEGLIDALSIREAGIAARILGVPGIGNLQHIEAGEHEYLIVPDGDDAGLGTGLQDGVDHLLLAGGTVKIANTPPKAGPTSIKQDANTYLKAGPEGLRGLLLDTRDGELSYKGEVKRLAKMSRADRDRSIKAVKDKHGVSIGTIRDDIKTVLQEEEDDDDGKQTQAKLLLELAEDAELFHTADSVAFADIQVNGHRETWRVSSKEFKKWLRRRYFETTKGNAPGSEAMQSAVSTIEANAYFASPMRETSVRVAELDGLLYLDMADDAWRAIEIGPSGWRVIDEPPVRFRRSPDMLPLPYPKTGGTIEGLRQFIRCKDDSDFKLAVAFVFDCFRGEWRPHAVLVLCGEFGSAKSTFSLVLQRLVDPHGMKLRQPPEDPRGLAIAANRAQVVAVDNISRLGMVMSDAYCRLASGAGFSTRSLYTDEDETIFRGSRPIILNGIEDFVTRGDLADRSVFVAPGKIADTERMPEADLWTAFNAEHPKLLGAFLTAVSEGLKRMPDMKLTKLPRMADFALWASACCEAVWPGGQFMDAYTGHLADAVHDMVEADAVAAAIQAFVTPRKTWEGTAATLLEELNRTVGRVGYAKEWPTVPKVLSDRIRRAAPNLRKVGINVEFSREKKARTRKILFSLAPVSAPNSASAASATFSERKSQGNGKDTADTSADVTADAERMADAEPNEADAEGNRYVHQTVPGKPQKRPPNGSADVADAVDAEIDQLAEDARKKNSDALGVPSWIVKDIWDLRMAHPTWKIAKIAKEVARTPDVVARVLDEADQ